jgi:hypothetical protein
MSQCVQREHRHIRRDLENPLCFEAAEIRPPPEQPSDDGAEELLGRAAASLEGQLPDSGRDALERNRKRRLPGVKGLEILDELLTRNVPTVVVWQKIERRAVNVPRALEQHTQVGVAKVAEHQARHVAGS